MTMEEAGQLLDRIHNELIENIQPMLGQIDEEHNERLGCDCHGICQADIKLQELLFWLEYARIDYGTFRTIG